MDYLYKASILITVFYLCYILFLKRETFFQHNRWFLVSGLLLSLLIPLITIPIETPVTTVSYIAPTSIVNLTESPLSQTTETATIISWHDIVLGTYLLGLFVFFIRFMLQAGSLIVLLIKNPKTKDGVYTYVLINKNITPFSFFQWIVYNPLDFEADELNIMLTHEKVHVNEMHSADIILAQLMCTAFWFNPIIWFYKKDINQNLEFIADNKTQNSINSKTAYQKLLVKASLGYQSMAMTNNFYNSLIKKRIVMLQKSESNHKNRLKLLLILPCIGLFMASFNTKNVYVEAALKQTTDYTTNKAQQLQAETTEILFTNNSTDAYLEQTKSSLKDKGIKMVMDVLNRNNQGIITKIDISFKTEKGSTNYADADKSGISPFYFKYSNDGALSVGAVDESSVLHKVVMGSKNNVVSANAKKDTIIITKANAKDSLYITSNSNKRFVQDLVVNDSVSGTVWKIGSGSNYKIGAAGKTEVIIGKIDSTKAVGTNPKNPWGFTITKAENIFIDSEDNYKTLSSDNKPLFIVNGEVVNSEEFIKIKSNSVKSFNVINPEEATKIYGKQAKNGARVIILNDDNQQNDKFKWSFEISKVESFPSATLEDIRKLNTSKNKPLLIIDNVISNNVNFDDLNITEIADMAIIKPEKAVEMHGNKAKHGAVLIFTKKSSDDELKYKTEISSISYVDDNKELKTLLYFISKITQNNQIDDYKTELQKEGITMKYSKLRRNKDGEITKIKITLDDNNGNTSTSTFQNNKGIPTINFGKYKEQLVISSKPF